MTARRYTAHIRGWIEVHAVDDDEAWQKVQERIKAMEGLDSEIDILELEEG